MNIDRVLVATVVAAAGWPALALADTGGRGNDWHMHNWGGGFLGPLMMILVTAVIVGVVVLIMRGLGGASHGPGAHAARAKTALDILKERYARGEIDKDEYEERRRVLDD